MSGDIDAFVLTGGASRRMGRDKAGLRFGDHSLAVRALEVLSTISQNVFAAGNKNIPGLTNVGDVMNHALRIQEASIFGLRSALFHSQTKWTAVLACDLPFVTDSFFQRLVATCRTLGDACDAIVPMQPDGRAQPLAALYKRDTCLPRIEQMIAAENYRLSSFVENIKAYRVLPSEYADLDETGRLFFNINTPEDYTKALELADASVCKA